MNLRIKRRKFGQLVIVSAASAAVANLAGKTTAAQPQLIIYGIRLTATEQSKEDLVNITPEINIIPLDLETGKELTTVVVPSGIVENRLTSIDIANNAVFTQPRERLTGFTPLADGTLIISSTFSSKKGHASRLIFVDNKVNKLLKGLKTYGFKRKNSTVESLLATKKEKLIGVVSLNRGAPPFYLVVIDQKTGKAASADALALPELPPNLRFSNLAQAPDGTIYATTLDQEGAVNLVQLDLANKAVVTGKGKIIKLSQLNFNNKTLANDLFSLTVSPSGQLFALADPNREGTNSLFTVEVKTGEMELLRKFDVNKIAFSLG